MKKVRYGGRDWVPPKGWGEVDGKPFVDEYVELLTAPYIHVMPDFSPSLHRHVAEQLEEYGSWGNNLPALIPDLNVVMESAAVVSALHKMLDGAYFRLPHVAGHLNPPHSEVIEPHQDRLWDQHYFSGPPAEGPATIAFAFYYPTGARVKSGPTVVYPDWPDQNNYALLDVPPGSVVIADFRLWHGRLPNHTDQPRWMVKYLFARVNPTMRLAPELLIKEAKSPVPHVRVNALHELGLYEETSIETILEAANDECGEAAQHALISLARHSHELTIKEALYPLRDALRHADPYARCSAEIVLERLGIRWLCPAFGPERTY